MSCWQYWVGFRLCIFDLCAVAFLLCGAWWSIFSPAPPPSPPGLSLFQWLSLAYIIIAFLSSALIAVEPVGPAAWQQFGKVFGSIACYVGVQLVLIRLLRSLDIDGRSVLLRCYLYGVVFSCGFELLEVVLAARGIDLIRMVFDPISRLPPTVGDDRTGFMAWDIFFRGNGFAGTNAQAAYIVTALPLLFVSLVRRWRIQRFIMAFLAVVALIVTMSRGGIASGVLCWLLLCILYYRSAPNLLVSTIIVTIPLVFIYNRYDVEIDRLLTTRASVDQSRLDMWQDGFQEFLRHPLGLGFGQYGYLFSLSSVDTAKDANTHNNFLQILVELGLPGLACQVLLLGSAALALWRRGGDLAKSGVVVIIGVATASMTSSILTSFFSFFSLALFIGCGFLEAPAAARAVLPAPRPLPGESIRGGMPLPRPRRA